MRIADCQPMPDNWQSTIYVYKNSDLLECGDLSALWSSLSNSSDHDNSLPRSGSKGRTVAARQGEALHPPFHMTALDDLRRFTVAHNFPAPTTLKRALHRMGFVQADPIRAPARAQDLILRQRVKDYRAGDLERRYATLDIEEDFFVIYGFVTRSLQALMHPRSENRIKEAGLRGEEERGLTRERQLLEFVRGRGEVHPREVDERFAHGKVTNYWGGSSNATTHLLDTMHYLGLLRVARREKGIRIYRPQEHGPGPTDPVERRERIDALVDVAVRLYAPLPGPSLTTLVSRLRYAVPQWEAELKGALLRAKERLAQTRVDGVDWYWLAKNKGGRGNEGRGGFVGR